MQRELQFARAKYDSKVYEQRPSKFKFSDELKQKIEESQAQRRKEREGKQPEPLSFQEAWKMVYAKTDAEAAVKIAATEPEDPRKTALLHKEMTKLEPADSKEIDVLDQKMSKLHNEPDPKDSMEFHVLHAEIRKLQTQLGKALQTNRQLQVDEEDQKQVNVSLREVAFKMEKEHKQALMNQEADFARKLDQLQEKADEEAKEAEKKINKLRGELAAYEEDVKVINDLKISEANARSELAACQAELVKCQEDVASFKEAERVSRQKLEKRNMLLKQISEKLNEGGPAGTKVSDVLKLFKA